jgi:hypothetical protein
MGVFETLREISKLVVKDVSRKIMMMDKQQLRVSQGETRDG